MDAVLGCPDGFTSSLLSGPKHLFPQLLEVLAAKGLHLIVSPGHALEPKRLPHLSLCPYWGNSPHY